MSYDNKKIKKKLPKKTFTQEFDSLEENDKKLFLSSLKKHNLTVQQFQLLRDVLYPNVQSYKTLLLAIEYCLARKLDIFKRTIQIVPIWDSSTEKYQDTIWPSISELRVTAHRTGQYAGNDKAEIIYNKDGCVSCMKHECVRKDRRYMECMNSITINQVLVGFDKIKKFI